MQFFNLVLSEKFVETNHDSYKLLTSQTDEEIVCPEKDIMAQAQNDGSVKITFLKPCKIINK